VRSHGQRLAVYRIGKEILVAELLSQLLRYHLLFQHHLCCTISMFGITSYVCGPGAMACPDTSRGWILIDLLEDSGLDLAVETIIYP